MKNLLPLTLTGLFFASCASVQEPASAPGDQWPSFRGLGTGRTTATDLPVRWSMDQNLAWSVGLEGFGQSSPVVFGDTVFVTSVEGPNKEHCIISAYGLANGDLLWTQSLPASLKIESSDMVSRGAPTPAVDAERVFAFFESGDLFALSHGGEVLWRRDLSGEYGEFVGGHGIGSSVVLAPDALVLLLDHDGPSYLLNLDPKTGANRWKLDREPRLSWSTPVLAAFDGGTEIIVSSNGSLEGIDLATGSVRWALEGLVGNTVPSPTVIGDRVLVGSSKKEGNLLALRGGEGRVAEVLWKSTDLRPLSLASPTVIGGRALFIGKAGVLFCASLETGELLWNQRLPGGCWASPIVAGERLYCFGKDGTTSVLIPGEGGAEVLAENRLETTDTVYGAAAVDGNLLVREGERLTCLRLQE